MDSPIKAIEEELEKEKDEETLIIEEETRISKFRRVIRPKPKKDTSELIDKKLLQGKSLQIYWYLFENGPTGVRELQRALNYNSPGIITYQIKKLSENNLIIKDETTDKYSINIRVKAGLLNFYVKLGPRLIPRFSLYLIVFFIGFMVFFLGSIFWGDQFIINPISLFFLFFLIFGSIAFIYESKMMWKLKPY